MEVNAPAKEEAFVVVGKPVGGLPIYNWGTNQICLNEFRKLVELPESALSLHARTGLEGIMAGDGGFGSVFKGLDTRSGRTVAIKIFGKAADGNEELRALLGSAASVVHEVVAAPLWTSVSPKGVRAVAFACKDGTLADFMDSVAKNAKRFGVQAMRVCHNLHCLLHRLNVDGHRTHGDLNSGNIAVTHTADGMEVRLLDMGLSVRLKPPQLSPRQQAALSPEELSMLWTACDVSLGGSNSSITPEMTLEGLVGVLSDLYGADTLMLCMLVGPPMMEAPMPGMMLGSQLRSAFIARYLHGRDEDVLGRWAREKLDLPRKCADLLALALAAGVAANPRDRPTYKDLEPVTLAALWGASVWKDMGEEIKGSGMMAALEYCDNLFALTIIANMEKVLWKLPAEERQAVHALAVVAEQQRQRLEEQVVDLVGSRSGWAATAGGEDQEGGGGSPHKKQRVAGGCDFPLTDMAYSTDSAAHARSVLGANSALSRLLPKLPAHTGATTEQRVAEVFSMLERVGQEGAPQQQQPGHNLYKDVQAPLKSNRSPWPSMFCWGPNLQLIDIMRFEEMDGEEMVLTAITDTASLLVSEKKGGWLPLKHGKLPDWLVKDIARDVLIFSSGLGHPLDDLPTPLCAQLADEAIDISNLVQRCDPQVALHVLLLLHDPRHTLLPRLAFPSAPLREPDAKTTFQPSKYIGRMLGSFRRAFSSNKPSTGSGLALFVDLAATRFVFNQLAQLGAKNKLVVVPGVLVDLRQRGEAMLAGDGGSAGNEQLAALMSLLVSEAASLLREHNAQQAGKLGGGSAGGSSWVPFPRDAEAAAQAEQMRCDFVNLGLSKVPASRRSKSAPASAQKHKAIRALTSVPLREGDGLPLVGEAFDVREAHGLVESFFFNSSGGLSGTTMPAGSSSGGGGGDGSAPADFAFLRGWPALRGVALYALHILGAEALSSGGTLLTALHNLGRPGVPPGEPSSPPAAASAARHMLLRILSAKQVQALRSVSGASSDAAAVDVLGSFLEAVLKQQQAARQASPVAALSLAGTSASSSTSISEPAQAGSSRRAVSRSPSPTKQSLASRVADFLAQLQQQHEQDCVDHPVLQRAFTILFKQLARGPPGSMKACPLWGRYQRLVASHAVRYRSLLLELAFEAADARPFNTVLCRRQLLMTC